VLASKSPRRRELLSAGGYDFDTVKPEFVERSDVHLTVKELTAFNALRKGLAVADARPQSIVLSADTLVMLDGEVIGKPRDCEDAARILGRLSGRTHQVCSSVFIFHAAQKRSAIFHEISHVRFRHLNGKKIARYLAKVNPLDKAGAYAAQGYGAEIIASIEGSHTNVVGLPMEKTIRALTKFGIVPMRSARSADVPEGTFGRLALPR
jgi:septum formation protein